MSEMGQKRPIPNFQAMSGVPPITAEIADIGACPSDLTGRALPLCPGHLYVDLLSYCDGIIHLDAKVSHGALDLGVTEQQLNSPQIAGAPVD